MKKIENFQLLLDATAPQKAMLPAGAKPLCVRILSKIPVVYVLTDPDQVLVPRRFWLIRTNFQLSDDFDQKWEYIDTFQYMDGHGVIMFHVFADREIPGKRLITCGDNGEVVSDRPMFSGEEETEQ